MMFAEFERALMRMAEEVGRMFKTPDEDWVPMAFSADSTGDVTVIPLFRLPKSYWVPALTEVVATVGAVKLGVIVSSWMTTPERGRVESLAVHAFDQEVVRMWTATIRRHDDRAPTLEPWEQWAEKDGLTLGGEIVNGLRGALR